MHATDMHLMKASLLTYSRNRILLWGSNEHRAAVFKQNAVKLRFSPAPHPQEAE